MFLVQFGTFKAINLTNEIYIFGVSDHGGMKVKSYSQY